MPEPNSRISNERRSARRWSRVERRKGGDRRGEAYKEFARALPARFLMMHGTPRERVLYLVNEYCCGCEESLKVDLAQALLPTLQAVVHQPRREISEEHMRACELAVERCVRQNEMETGRWDTPCMDNPGERVLD